MKVQITLTVSESKRLIAKAVTSLPEVTNALANGKIILKGGTTVSAISEEMVRVPLRISGRITERGAVSAKSVAREHPHTLLLDKGKMKNIDEDIIEVVQELRRDDVIIISGNALDVMGNAAMLAGAASGGNPGMAIPGMLSQGAHVIIPIGLEKLIPGSIQDAVRVAGRDVDLSYGMGVGMIPLIGRVITEKDAVEILASVECTVIARGGISGAEGSTVMNLTGQDQEIKKLLRIVDEVKGAVTSGEVASMEECDGRGPRCKEHTGCIYKGDKKR